VARELDEDELIGFGRLVGVPTPYIDALRLTRLWMSAPSATAAELASSQGL
jgi:hypothetical protein